MSNAWQEVSGAFPTLVNYSCTRAFGLFPSDLSAAQCSACIQRNHEVQAPAPYRSDQAFGISGELPLPEGARENQVVGDAKLEQDRAVQRFVYYTGRAMTAGDTAQALASVSRFFAPWSGEKVLIWISAGTTIPVPAAELAANRIRVFPLNVHANMPYMFISSFTHRSVLICDY